MGTGSFRVVCAREQGKPEEEIVEAVAEQTVPAEPAPLR
jgi:hypothetical protein